MATRTALPCSVLKYVHIMYILYINVAVNHENE